MKVPVTVSVEYEDLETLREWASSRGRSVSDVVREGVEMMLGAKDLPAESGNGALHDAASDAGASSERPIVTRRNGGDKAGRSRPKSEGASSARSDSVEKPRRRNPTSEERTLINVLTGEKRSLAEIASELQEEALIVEGMIEDLAAEGFSPRLERLVNGDVLCWDQQMVDDG